MKELPGYLKATIILLFLYLLFGALYLTKSFLVPFSIAALFAFLLLPVSKRLESWNMPRVPAIILSILLAIVVFAGLIFFFYSQVMSFREDLPLLEQQMRNRLTTIQSFIEKTTHISEKQQIEMAKEKASAAMETGGTILVDFFAATGTFIAMLALIPIYVFFLTFYRNKFEIFILKVSGPNQHNNIIKVITKMSKITQKYLTGLLIDIVILSILNSVGLLLLGIKHAILLAVLASILNIIPYIGVLIGSLFPIAMAILTKDSLWYAVGAAGVCIFVQFLDNNFITPKVVGSSVSLNPLATLIVLLIGGLVWGVAGMMLFIPFLGMLKVIFDNIEFLQPYGYLIGDDNTNYEKMTTIDEVGGNNHE